MKRIILLLTILSISFSYSLSQENNQTEQIKINGKTYTKPELRMRHFDEMRAYPFQKYSHQQRVRAINQANTLLMNANKKTLIQAEQPEWECIGPFKVSGRVKSIAYDQENEGVVYIGAAAGGIWKTTNSGDDWTPIFDYENGIGFGSICIDPNNSNVIYAATGEAVLNSAAPMYLSAGVFKSTDAGDNWSLIGLTQVGSFSKIYVHPKNSNIVVAASVGSNSGFYKSTDGGASWKKSENFDKNISDLTYNPDDENEYFIGVMGEGVFMTTDLGETWTLSSAGIPTSAINRISVQMAYSNPNILYALIEDNGVGNIYKSTNHGSSWSRSYKGNSSFFNGQGWYDNYIMINPENPDIVFAGGIDVWRTENGGQSTSSWENVTNGYQGGNVHVDQHCGAFSPFNSNEIFIGNDGGVFRSTNLGSSFTNENNGLSITQFYSMDIDRSQENRNYGGSQDNGTLGNFSNPDVWNRVYGGDGFQTVVDFDNPTVVYGEVYVSNPGSIFPFSRNLQTGDTKLLTNGILSSDISGIWDPPLEIHPLYSPALYHGRNALYYSFNNGYQWSVGIKTQANKFTAIGISPINELVVYSGDIGGGLFVTKDHFESVVNTSSNGLVARAVTGIECSGINEETAFVTVSGFGTNHIFKTTNAGDKWESISRNFPDIPCNCIIMHPENEDWLFVGTDIGIFATFDGGQSWLPFGRNLPRTIVTDLKIYHDNINSKYILRASTFGRSMWQVDLPNEFISDLEITSPIGGESLVGTSEVTFSWYGFKQPAKVELSFDDGANWITIADGIYANSMKYELPNKITYLNRIRVSSKYDETQMKISNTFSITTVSRGSVLQTSSFGHVPYGIAWDGGDYLWSTSFYGDKLYKVNKDNFKVVNTIKIPGDSLFTDLTINKSNGNFYVHRMNSSGDAGTGGVIEELDKDGTLINSSKSPAKQYPIGLELVDGDLIVCDRDGTPKKIYVMNPKNGYVKQTVNNPFQEYLGPRGLCYDGEQYLYQASTKFSTSSGILGTYIIKFDKINLSQEIDRIPLNSRNGLINCRGIEYDPSDKNFWITDFGGNIYKIAGFETISNIDDGQNIAQQKLLDVDISPNPMVNYSNISLKSNLKNKNVQIEIVDGLGQIMKIYNKNLFGDNSIINIQLNAKDFNSGYYYIIFSIDDNKVMTKKLVVIK